MDEHWENPDAAAESISCYVWLQDNWSEAVLPVYTWYLTELKMDAQKHGASSLRAGSNPMMFSSKAHK